MAIGLRMGILQRRTPGNHPFLLDLPANWLTYRKLKKANSQISLGEFLKVISSIDLPIKELGQLLLKQNAIALKKRLEQKIEEIETDASAYHMGIRVEQQITTLKIERYRIDLYEILTIFF